MAEETSGRKEELALTLMRIVVGAAFFAHGAQKLFGWFGGFGPDGGTAELMSRFGAAGTIETVCGAAVLLGVATRAAAFLASGEMAVAYFWMHVGSTGALFWWANRGEVVMIFSFTFLYFAARGAGPYSVDGWLARRRAAAYPGGAGAAPADAPLREEGGPV